MLKFMGKKIFTILSRKFLLIKPVLLFSSGVRKIGPFVISAVQYKDYLSVGHVVSRLILSFAEIF